MIEANGVSLRYPDGTAALKDVNLKIPSGATVYVTGPSGAGKTSLLKLLLGIESPSSGSLEVLGLSMEKVNAMQLRRHRRRMGPVFQELRLIPGRTALENVMLGMRFLNFSGSEMKHQAYEALARVGLKDKCASLSEHLSWGESQRVAIARAFVRRPALILADEPTGNLDKDNALNILRLLTEFPENKPTVIITTHATHLLYGKEGDIFLHLEQGCITLERRMGA